jgi:general secretion pathway protein G
MRAKGFTLVEILIVVVILGILAAIVIPQFTGASTEAKESSLVSNLQSIRSQIELFKIQHNDLIPGEIMATNGNITQATADTFVNAMCNKTDQYGNVDPDGTDPSTYRFGPYMKKVPENPFSNASGVQVAGLAEDGAIVAAGAAKLGEGEGGSTSGWYYVCTSARTDPDFGHFQAADPLTNPTDTTYYHVEY